MSSSSQDFIRKIKELEDKSKAAEFDRRNYEIEKQKEKDRIEFYENDNARIRSENAQLKIEIEILTLKMENMQLKTGQVNSNSRLSPPNPKQPISRFPLPNVEQKHSIDIFQPIMSPSYERSKTPGPQQKRASKIDLDPSKIDLAYPKQKNESPVQKSRQTSARGLPVATSPPIQINPIPNILNKQDCRLEGNKINHSPKNNNLCIVAFDPVVSSGITRFQGFFDKISSNCMIGIADASIIFDANASIGQYKGKILSYSSINGFLQHMSFPGIRGNKQFINKQIISCEVDLASQPKSVHFFVDNEEQRNYVVDIPPAIRFMICLFNSNSQFTIQKLEKLSCSSAIGVDESKEFEWGQNWNNE
ncbi:MAG: hypothetical protein EZS28_003858 [Streblomastix strix]|uniref:SPRY domain-containing protein n=1 Tax=Streblomastix strix TaxID=222440 RepID=A0A5J4X000_9EUKA|nr:MAG: hypothetical protein EZS28_003858 [Streblomastix strix]